MFLRKNRIGTLVGRVRISLIILLAFAAIVGLVIGSSAALLPRNGQITHGVKVNSINLGGMTEAQAKELLTGPLTAATKATVHLSAGGQKRAASLRELGIHADLQATVHAAYAIGRENGLLARLANVLHARWGGVHLSPVYVMDDKAAKAVLSGLGSLINREPLDASAYWNGSQVVVNEGHSGAKLDAPASLKIIKSAVYDALAARKPIPTTVELPYREKHPHVTAKALQDVDTVLGSFSTSYGSSSRNRINNIVTAAEAINHHVLLPGEVFSFNKTVGPRTEDSGFMAAPVIINGEMEQGLGGGICQVSTTLYNAVLFSGLNIVTRNHHSIPSHYVAPGLDATVSYGSLDFRFRNSSDAPVVIETQSQGRRLLVRILGKGPAPVVKLVRSDIHSLPGRTITKNDPTLPKGTKTTEQKGSGGIAVTVTRIVGTGSDAKSEVLSHDRYPGQPTVIVVGTGARKPTTPVSSTEPITAIAKPAAN